MKLLWLIMRLFSRGHFTVFTSPVVLLRSRTPLVEAAWTFVVMWSNSTSNSHEFVTFCLVISPQFIYWYRYFENQSRHKWIGSYFRLEERKEGWFWGCFLFFLNRRWRFWLRSGLQSAGFWGIHLLLSKRQRRKYISWGRLFYELKTWPLLKLTEERARAATCEVKEEVKGRGKSRQDQSRKGGRKIW